jgi:hypothetical protein
MTLEETSAEKKTVIPEIMLTATEMRKERKEAIQFAKYHGVKSIRVLSFEKSYLAARVNPYIPVVTNGNNFTNDENLSPLQISLCDYIKAKGENPVNTVNIMKIMVYHHLTSPLPNVWVELIRKREIVYKPKTGVPNLEFYS